MNFPPVRHALLFFCIAIVSWACGFSTNGSGGEAEEAQFKVMRLQMVEEQLRQRSIDDERVLKVMETVPRHLFVPPSLRSRAYEDGPLPIGEEQTISQPYIVALMSEALVLTGTETVLEVGTGSGYQAAVLSRLAKQVYSIEILPRLAESARTRLATLGYDNVNVVVGDGNQGWPAGSPYDAIIVTAAAPRVPQALLDQLDNGGRLVLPVGTDKEQHLFRLRKTGNKVTQENLGPVRFVPLVGGEL
jgi:protein-L-isoaspartate(D-aspartate) O-methyltransferase